MVKASVSEYISVARRASSRNDRGTRTDSDGKAKNGSARHNVPDKVGLPCSNEGGGLPIVLVIVGGLWNPANMLANATIGCSDY